MIDWFNWSSEWSNGVPALDHRRRKKRGRPERHRLGGGHWLKRGQDGGTEEGAVPNGVEHNQGRRDDRNRRRTSTIYNARTVRCEVWSRDCWAV